MEILHQPENMSVPLNDSHLNPRCIYAGRDDSEAGLALNSILLLINVVVGLPANVWMVWLACHREMFASDIYLLSLAACEILYCVGLPAQLYCTYTAGRVSQAIVILLEVQWDLVWVGRPIFNISSCVERYIAVVHPLIFIRLKPLKYKVAQAALVWCAFFLMALLLWTIPEDATIPLFWILPSLCIMLFCCFSVLWSLKRPGPGDREGGDERRRGDAIKKKAFHIILVHLACYVLNYLPLLVAKHVYNISGIVVDLCKHVGLNCGLVQPLLYLHRAGKLSCVREHRPQG